MTKTQGIYGAAVALGLLAAYVALTLAGHDGSLLLGALLGQLGGTGLTAAAGSKPSV